MTIFDINDDLRSPALNIAKGVVVVKEDDQSVTNSTAIQTDDSIVWDVVAGNVYLFVANVMYVTVDAADIMIGWTAPAGASVRWNGTGYSAGSAYQNFANADPIAGGPTSFGGSDGSAARVARVTGTIETADEDGEFNLVFRQFVANAATTTILAGTYGVLKRLS